MHIIVVGLNHRAAPLDVREQVAFGPDQISPALLRLQRDHGLHEAAILSTCNRVELYASASDVPGTVERLSRFLSIHSGLPVGGLRARLYSFSEPASVRHLFSVASGLDSMVLGEAEILRQVKDAYEWARGSGTAGKAFNALFQRAFNAAKTVRAQTGIGQGQVSIGSVAVELAEKIFKQLSGATVLVIGVGKIGFLTLKRLTQRGVREVRIMNRSLERAVTAADTLGGRALPWERLSEQLAEVDLVITSTAAGEYLLTRAAIARAMRERRRRALCVVDLGVPRNVDPTIAHLENVYLFDVDSLTAVVERATRARQGVVDDCLRIIDRKVALFLSWWQAECGDGASSGDWHAGQLAGAGAGEDRPEPVGQTVSRSAA
jgi:glutamyl-tRNA reductase